MRWVTAMPWRRMVAVVGTVGREDGVEHVGFLRLPL